MNPSDYRICLDVQAPHGAVELDAKQGDSQRRIFITLTDGGVPYGITEDCRPLLTAKKPDGTVLYNLCRVEQNTAIYPLTRQTTACPGRVRCELRLYSNELTVDEEGKPSADSAQLLTAATFTLLVHPQVCSDEDALSSLPESTQLEQLVSDTQALLTHVQTKLEQGDFVGEKGDPGEKGDKGEKGDRGEKGDPGEVNIDDGQVSEESTWSSMQISAEIHDCVGYYPQNKANSQKAQARENIGALGHTITKPVRISNGDQDAVILTAQTIFDQDSLMADVLTLQGDREGQIDTDSVVLRGLHEGVENTDAVNKKQLDDSSNQLRKYIAGNCVYFTQQELGEDEKAFARQNIGAVDSPYVMKKVEQAEVDLIDKLCPAFTESGAVVTCQPVEGYPLQVVSSIVPKQNGEPSPENVCPIEGHTEVKLTRCGKNLFDISKIKTTTITESQYVSTCEITEVGADYIAIKTYPGYGGNGFANTNVKFRELCPSVRVGDTITVNATTDAMQKIFYLTPSATVIRFGVAFEVTEAMLDSTLILYGLDNLNGNGTQGTGVCITKNIQVEFGNAATAYEPYKAGNTFTMDLDQTVYGGTLDWSTGELTITHCKEVFDGSVNKFTGTGTAGGNAYCTASLSHNAKSVSSKAYCSHLKQKVAYEYGAFYITGSTYKGFAAYIKEFTNMAEANGWLADQNSNGTPLTVCYEMAEPIKVQLTPQQIVALSGSNTLRSDTGDTTVTGKASPATEIEKLKNAILSLGGNL